MSAARSAPKGLYYGWIVIAVAFVTMAFAVSARTGYSLLFPELVDEFGWDSGLTAGAFSVGFVASTVFLPLVGFLMSRYGPRATIPMGALLVAAGYVAARHVSTPIELYAAFGLLAVNGSMAMSYIGHSMFLPNWFVRNRGLAVGIAFSGVGVGGIVLLPALQWLIDSEGWRTACLVVGVVTIVAIVPLNVIFQRTRPEDVGLLPDGDASPDHADAPPPAPDAIVDRKWAGTEWTLALAVRTARFWWVAAGMFCALFVWYGTQVHQTRHLIDAGIDTETAALALGMVPFCGIAGQIGIGALSDRLGREIGWSLAIFGFVISSLLMIEMIDAPLPLLLWSMVVAQGLLGNGLTSMVGAIPAEIFGGRRFPTIFAATSLVGNCGAGAGVYALGALHDVQGDYETGFWICAVLSVASATFMWLASPRKVRLVAGQARRRARQNQASG